jgi:hypothetical protein
MAASQQKTLRLGDRKYILRRPTLGHLRAIVDALDEMTAPGKTGGPLIEASVHLVCAGLIPAQPELTVEELLQIETSVQELNEAVQQVLTTAGLRPVEESQAGEAVPQLLAAK